MEEHDFQLAAEEQLRKGRSVLIVAPTGLGKTRAALKPFVANNGSDPILDTRLIYALPLRALARGVANELAGLAPTYHPVIHHGDEPESEVFSERAVITTVDQYFTAFAGAPLSWAFHKGHAAAGAVLTSYSVFDEVHLLSSKAGLQLLFAILRLRQRWGLLSCVMTATMPESVANFFEEFCGLETVEASAGDINKRDSWRKVDLQLLGEKTPGRGGSKSRKQAERSGFEWQEKDPQGIAELVKEKWEGWNEVEVDGPRKIIVFMNTVDRAIQVHQHLQGLCPDTVLAHSRFTKEHRQQVEDRIQQFFGKGSQETDSILVTTQVAEAGLNISAPLVISELAPMDSLIQRAGRCQRFKPNENNREMRGLVLVVKPKAEGRLGWYAPYMDYVIVQGSKGGKRVYVAEASCHVLGEHFANGGLLSWDMEKNLVNEALSEAYEAFLKGSDRLQFSDVKDRPLGKVYQQLVKMPSEQGEAAEEEYSEQAEPEEQIPTRGGHGQ